MADAAPETKPDTPAPKLVKMELKRHYVPKKQPPNIVGWNRPERRVKDAAGRETVVQEGGFVPGEMCPPPQPGVGYPNKVWAGTVIEVPEDEARTMRTHKIAEAWI